MALTVAIRPDLGPVVGRECSEIRAKRLDVIHGDGDPHRMGVGLALLPAIGLVALCLLLHLLGRQLVDGTSEEDHQGDGVREAAA